MSPVIETLRVTILQPLSTCMYVRKFKSQEITVIFETKDGLSISRNVFR